MFEEDEIMYFFVFLCGVGWWLLVDGVARKRISVCVWVFSVVATNMICSFFDN